MITPLERTFLRMDIEKVLDSLPSRYASVIRLYYGLDDEAPMTFRQIAERVGVSATRVQQIKESALRRLRHPRRSHVLEAYK